MVDRVPASGDVLCGARQRGSPGVRPAGGVFVVRQLLLGDRTRRHRLHALLRQRRDGAAAGRPHLPLPVGVPRRVDEDRDRRERRVGPCRRGGTRRNNDPRAVPVPDAHGVGRRRRVRPRGPDGVGGRPRALRGRVLGRARRRVRLPPG